MSVADDAVPGFAGGDFGGGFPLLMPFGGNLRVIHDFKK